VIKSLLFAQADPNVGLLNGITPLHLAAKKGDPWITQILLQAGANPYVADENGNTPLDFAAAHNAPREVFNLLLETEMKSIQVDYDMFENFDDLANTFQFPPNFSMEVSVL
jgi:ankyrin repeat protein